MCKRHKTTLQCLTAATFAITGKHKLNTLSLNSAKARCARLYPSSYGIAVVVYCVRPEHEGDACVRRTGTHQSLFIAFLVRVNSAKPRRQLKLSSLVECPRFLSKCEPRTVLVLDDGGHGVFSERSRSSDSHLDREEVV